MLDKTNTPHLSLTPWVTEKFIAAAPQAAAQAMAGLATHEALALLKPLKAESIRMCLNLMPADKAAAVLRRLPSRQAAHILARLEIKQAGLLYKTLSGPQREKMKTLLDASFIKALEHCLDWPSGSAGALMSRDFLSFKTDNKVSDIVDKLKTLPRKKLPAACVIVNKDGQAKGFIRTAELVFYSLNAVVGSVMSEIKTLPAAQAAEQARGLLEQGQPLVPVTDAQGVVLGILTEQILFTAAPAKKKRFGWF